MDKSFVGVVGDQRVSEVLATGGAEEDRKQPGENIGWEDWLRLCPSAVLKSEQSAQHDVLVGESR